MLWEFLEGEEKKLGEGGDEKDRERGRRKGTRARPPRTAHQNGEGRGRGAPAAPNFFWGLYRLVVCEAISI